MQTSDSLRLIALREISVSDARLRALGELDVLKSSITETGLLQPIVVDTTLRLVCGYHRLEACRQLGWDTIPAVVQDLDASHARLAEIDENLCRRELTALERGEHTALRKQLFSATTAAVAVDAKALRSKKNAKTDESTRAFLEDTAKRTGRSKSTVAEDIRIGELPNEVREAVRETPLRDKKKELVALTKMSPDQQSAAVARVKAGDARTVRATSERRPRLEMPVVPRVSPASERTSEGAVRNLDDAIDALGCALAGFPQEEVKLRAVVEEARDRLVDVAARLRNVADASAALKRSKRPIVIA